MNDEINTGGPAFPHDDQAQHYERAGMTMRDYFAAKVMHAVLSTPKLLQATSDGIAEMSYAMADAMIKARNNK